MITIHYDFTDGTEVSYIEGENLLKEGKSFTTNCLDFFQTRNDAVVIRKDGKKISVKELLSNKKPYTVREIREAHNLQKMLKAGALEFL